MALITGGDSGIGRAVSIHLAKEGADIAIVYVDEDIDAEETKSLVEAAGRKCLLIKGDVKSDSFCKKAVDKVVAEFEYPGECRSTGACLDTAHCLHF